MQYYIYILTNKPHGTLYIEVTNNLTRRIFEQKSKLAAGFTKKYGFEKLVYYEVLDTAEAAIRREKNIKKWNRD